MSKHKRGKVGSVSLKAALSLLKSASSPAYLEGMGRFAINTQNALGVSVPQIRSIAKEIGPDHGLALQLWGTGVHEALMLAVFIDEPEKVTEAQVEEWVGDFDSWDICDQACGNLFDKTSFAYPKAFEWSRRREEFVKRAGFALMAALAVHDKLATDEKMLEFLPVIERESGDARNFVKKAVNWALRQVGKRNLALNKQAIKCAKKIRLKGDASSKWIASNALSELEGSAVQMRLAQSSGRQNLD